jgi:flavin reductase (DIM6/NTAB) family NADH-FMN oxidoreductase RutF
VAPSPLVESDVPKETTRSQDLPETMTDSTWTCPKGEKATAEAVRKAMRKLPHPVVIVTACRESSSPIPPEPIDPKQDNVELLSPYYQDFCGATISSLQTVTLGPPAMISFNLKMPSRTLSGLLHHKHFGVHILLGKLAGVHIADAFLQQSHNEAFQALTRRGLWVGLGLGPGQSRVNNPEKNIPLIRGHGVVSFMRCEVIPDKCMVVGDHMVVIAKVAAIGLSPSRDDQSYSSLAYQKGKYGGTLFGITGYDPAKPPSDHKIPGPVWQIKKNNLGVHNDSLALIDGDSKKAKD